MGCVMQRTAVFSCKTGGLIAPCELLRPRRGARPRSVAPGSPLDVLLAVDVGALDPEWRRWAPAGLPPAA